MTLATDLLKQAKQLAALDPKKPKQASLRRAVSASYYSLFHLLIADGAHALVGTSRLKPVLARAFQHTKLKDAAGLITKVHTGHKLAPLFDFPVAADLVEVCAAFIELQERRHVADYDTAERFTRVETLALVSKAEEAHRKWSQQRASHNARVFILLGLELVGKR
jgi:uncharacterized protein (UPF0332 family)